MRIDLVRSPHPPIFEAELEPPADICERSSPENEAEIKVLFTKRNRIAVYDVIVQKMTDAVDQEVLGRLRLKWSETPLLLVVCTHLGLGEVSLL